MAAEGTLGAEPVQEHAEENGTASASEENGERMEGVGEDDRQLGDSPNAEEEEEDEEAGDEVKENGDEERVEGEAEEEKNEPGDELRGKGDEVKDSAKVVKENEAANKEMQEEKENEDEIEKEQKGEDLRRMDTIEFLSKLRGQVGKHSASIHDHPKIKKLLEDEDSNTFSKLVKPNMQSADQTFAAQLSDYCELDQMWTPLHMNEKKKMYQSSFISPNERVLCDIISHANHTTVSKEFVRAGPREIICFDPKKVKACIVTCGGLCPGLNTVIREIYMALTNLYGVEQVYGIPYGYQGFYHTSWSINQLTEDIVSDIHHEGGSILGCSRGGHDTKLICDAIEDFNFNQVYIIGGDGTHRGAIKIFQELKKRKVAVSVIGIPKTIDNDMAVIDRSFGFDTAVEEAQRAIASAKTEATSALNGIGLVKLMGRHSGHIAMFSVLASRDVDVCLIPEIKFELEGSNGLYAYLEELVDRKGHAVVVIAEGAGEDLVIQNGNAEKDASGNTKLPDIGLWLKGKIVDHFKKREKELTLKYIDPTYMIRTVPANASDNLYCSLLGQNAVHGAFAGYSGFTAGLVNTYFVYIPMGDISKGRVKVDVNSRMWHRVISTTRQPRLY